jgi:AraC family transcriptional regulator
VSKLLNIVPTRTERSDQPAPAALCDPLAAVETRRARLLESPIAIVEDVGGPGLPQSKSPEGFSPEFQVCFPYRGLFVWHVGDDQIVGDANQVLFVSGGESYHLSQDIAGAYAELIVTPDLELLAEIAGTSETRLQAHPLFRRRRRRADFRLQSQHARLLHRASGAGDDVAAEEMVIDLLRSALSAEAQEYAPAGKTRRLIRSTKEFLHAHLSSRLRLRDVARAVGASPAYLTHVFGRVEGLPIHRYLMQLRLARALVELPHADDLTELAFALGFSSHSHFAAEFRRAFNCTPSQFRASSAPARGAPNDSDSGRPRCPNRLAR